MPVIERYLPATKILPVSQVDLQLASTNHIFLTFEYRDLTGKKYFRRVSMPIVNRPRHPIAAIRIHVLTKRMAVKV